MPLHTLQLTPARIGKFKAETIAHAIPYEVLGITGRQKRLPKNSGDTYVARRWLPYGATTTNHNTINRPTADPAVHVAQEGVTPNAETIVPQDVSCQMQQYIVLYGYTDRTFDMYEDDIPMEMKKQTGERTGLVREMVRYGTLKACTNVFYGGSGTSRSTVNGPLTLNLLRRVRKNLFANHGKSITQVLAPSPNYDTSAVQASYLVFCHSDLEPDIVDLPDFVPVAKYGQRKMVHENEIGACGPFRFVISSELSPYLGAGASVGSTGLIGGSNIDVYPVIVCCEDAWSQVALRGADSMGMIWLPPSQQDKSDPAGQRGYVGAKFYFACMIENNGWMAVCEVGATNV